MNSNSLGSDPSVATTTEHRPQRVGPYRIIELLGEGGMGEVYRAERLHPIRQNVAVKIIKLGFGSREIIGRFESERQALALMDHPGIAKVFDAGTTDAGRPYFVMELVNGNPITRFCDENRLSIPDRLKLFMEVCDAIAHAHSKAIIHRDIKPSNVMAYTHGSTFGAKVIDFGVAKALSGDRMSDQTFHTARGQAVGTYDSMSPEQANGSPDIDTRTDVYSLGVLLYELLTGTKPFDHATLSSSSDAEIKRIIQEVDPPRPSTRLSKLGQDATAFAERRQSKLDVLSRQLREELEWIPLKAMRKERARRYASPLQLKEDVQNYLDDKPLLAGPESRVYRLRKFAHRNWRGVVASAAMLLIVITGTLFYIHNIRAEQTKTRLALVDSERQRAEAQKQAKIAQDSTNFLATIFRNADPNRSLGADITVVQIMEETIKKLDGGWLKPEPITEAMVRCVIGTTLQSLGHYDDALPQLMRARELDQKYRSPGDPQIPATLNDLGLLLTNQGKFDEADPIYREALQINQATLPPNDPAIGKSMAHLGMLMRSQQKFAEAERMLRDAIALERKTLPADDPDVLLAINSLAAVLWNGGRLSEAEPLCREVLQARRKALPAEHPYVAQSIHNLAALLRDQKKFDEAEPLAREALALRRKIFPPEHPETATALHTLAGILNGLKKYAQAETYGRESLAIRRKALPADHPHIATGACDLAWLLQMQGKFAEAEPLFREALQIRSARFGPKSASTTKTAALLAGMLDQANRPTEAADLRQQFDLSAPATQRAKLDAPSSSGARHD
ncbi:hypothetical protein BH09PLA1_BH09PLA1_03260 [soil metagenome]